MREADQTLLNGISALDSWIVEYVPRLAYETYSDHAKAELGELTSMVYLMRQQLSCMRSIWKDDAAEMQEDAIRAQM